MSALRFDGLYCAREDGYLMWIRFYEDGLVLKASSTAAKAEQVARWLRPSHPHLSSGRWSLDQESLSFTTTSANGSVDFAGYAYEDTLTLGYVSRINGHSAQDEWRFHPLDAHTLDGPLEVVP